MSKVTDEELISCLLKNGGNQHATANELGLSDPTVCHRLKLKHTQALLQKTRQRILDNSINSLISMNNKAVERLEKLLDDENPFVRLQATGNFKNLPILKRLYDGRGHHKTT